MSHPVATREYGIDELPGCDGDGEVIEMTEQCQICEGAGYYDDFQMVNGTPEWKERKCLCKILDDMDSIANERKDE